MKLSKRQLDILECIRQNEQMSNRDIQACLHKNGHDISRVTVVRDTNTLFRSRLIKKIGGGRSVAYQEAAKNYVLRHFDAVQYFQKPPDERTLAFSGFNFEIFRHLKNIFTSGELKKLETLNNNYKKRVRNMPPAIMKKEFERLAIELSWKSSRIEGNTYSLIDTEILIKEHKEAKGHSPQEAMMILNHKKALDHIVSARGNFQNITLRTIEHIHKILVERLGVAHGLRKKPVGIVGTVYKPLDNIYQIKEAIESVVALVNTAPDPFSKALTMMLMISYIQPFEDGNKRTARIMGDALLLAHGACPLSFRSVDEADYKKALILFYEQNSIVFFKKLFMEQFTFAVQNYFQ